jgi:hypothetical protein
MSQSSRIITLLVRVMLSSRKHHGQIVELTAALPERRLVGMYLAYPLLLVAHGMRRSTRT